MTLQELIELAILDAMGLLDDDERELFECAFGAAAPALQAQVRREQTRLSRIEMLLPDVTPPAGLRAIVLQAVRNEMARAESSHSRDLIVPALVPSRGVSPLWRAASLGLLAAVLVLAVTMFLFQSQHQRAMEQARTDALVAKMGEEFGPAFVRDILFGPDTRRVVFVADTPGFRGQASVFVNPDWKEAKFFCDAIASPPGRTLRVAIVDENDNVVETLTTFTSDGGFTNRGVALDLSASAIAGNSLAIITSDDQTILSRAKLQS